MENSLQSLTIQADIFPQTGRKVHLDVSWDESPIAPVEYLWVYFIYRNKQGKQQSDHLFISTDQQQTVIRSGFLLKPSYTYDIHISSIKKSQFPETYHVLASGHRKVTVDGTIVRETFKLERRHDMPMGDFENHHDVEVKNTHPNSRSYSLCGLNCLPHKEGKTSVYMMLLHQDWTDTSLLLGWSSLKAPVVKLPGDLIPAMNYTVTVHVAYEVNNAGRQEFKTAESSCQFSFCTVMTQYQLKELADSAEHLISEVHPTIEIRHFYRNKSPKYWENVMRKGTEIKYIKNASGDKASVINKNEDFKGLFFNTRINRKKKPPQWCVFGPKRLSIQIHELFNENTNLYFADFYCQSKGAPHKVVLVVTKKGSETDRFCKERLRKLDIFDNPFLTLNTENRRARIPDPQKVYVEVCYTENIQVEMLIKNKTAKFTMLWHEKRAKDTSKGIPKRQGCKICNLKQVIDFENHLKPLG